MRPSFISSSRQHLGPPWGLLCAVALVLVLELALRWFNPGGGLTSRYSAGHEYGYRAVPVEIERGVGDVVVIGSSRARRGLLAPVLHEALAKRGLPSRVKNFSLNAAQAEELELLVRRLGEAQPRPKLIVWAITARELEEREEHPGPYVRHLARPADWLRARRQLGGSVDRLLPDALRNEAARWSYVVRCRFALRNVVSEVGGENSWASLQDAVWPAPALPTPMQGALPASFYGEKHDATRNVSKSRVKRYLGDAYTQRGWPNNYQAEHLQAAVAHARQLGMPLLLIEIPVHELLEKMMPPKTQQKFRSYMKGVGKRYEVSFVPGDGLGVEFVPADFLEQSHLNFRGSLKYTEAIAPRVADALDGGRGGD